MDTLTIRIHRATHSFLYLPTYIAKDLEIFETVIGAKRTINGEECQIKVDFAEPKGGDEEAISAMISDTANNVIAIAIGSPVAFLSPTMNENTKKNVRVIGAIINKLTFWAVDHQTTTCKDIESLKTLSFQNLIFPNERFVNACYLARLVQQKVDIKESGLIPVPFETELAKLRIQNEVSKTAVAITADIATLASTTIGANPEFHINYKFSELGDFLTTGIITSKESCDRFPEIIVKIIEAIQKSFAILSSSEKNARRVCAQIAVTNFSNKFCPDTTKEDSEHICEIIKMMNKEGFYPADLNISKKGWDRAVNALARAKMWDEKDNETGKTVKQIYANSYYDYVDNRYVRKSERNIADFFGIDMYSFRMKDILGHIFARPVRWIWEHPRRRYIALFLIVLFLTGLVILLGVNNGWWKWERLNRVGNWVLAIVSEFFIVHGIEFLIKKRK